MTRLERRKEQRQRTFLGGKLTFNQRRSVLDCLVRNIAPTGAMIEFADTAAIVPDAVDLHIGAHDQSFRAAVVWREHDRAGIALSPFEADEPVLNLDTVRRQRAMKREIRALRKQLDYSS
jgi:hypothetical protein